METGTFPQQEKAFILEEGKAVPFLVDLGVQTKDGKTVNSRYDKFRQINRFLEFIEDILPELDKGRELTILDILSSTVSPSTLNEKDPPIISELRTGEFPK